MLNLFSWAGDLLCVQNKYVASGLLLQLSVKGQLAHEGASVTHYADLLLLSSATRKNIVYQLQTTCSSFVLDVLCICG